MSIKTDLEQINKDLSFGVSFSQGTRNDHGRDLCIKIGNSIVNYTNKLIDLIDKKPDEALTEMNEHTIS